jgi:Protein of unknown function (DUF992)
MTTREVYVNRILLGLGALAFGLITAFGGANAQDRVQAGTLVCDVSGGIGMIIGSHKEVQCLFNPNQPGPTEAYFGGISKFGLDIGATSAGQMVWAVFAPTSRAFGALAGVYTGATAEATIAVGLGANVLVGGSNRTIALQPLSVTGQTGLNLAAGVAQLELRSGR